ncbi:MAG: DUF2505 domain-containing protein [Pseudomonadales bacterium]|nr:DUF2505 domain-containing protein [Pseudomonadales bacterium]
MDLVKNYHYDISSEELIEIFLDKQFTISRFEKSGVTDYEIEHFGEKNGKFVISIRRKLEVRPPEKLPGILKKMIKGSNTMVTTVAWDLEGKDSRTGIYQYGLEGVPVDIMGTTVIKPSGNGCVNEVRVGLKTSIPFVGKQLSKIMTAKIESGLDKNHEATLRYIDEVLELKRIKAG